MEYKVFLILLLIGFIFGKFVQKVGGIMGGIRIFDLIVIFVMIKVMYDFHKGFNRRKYLGKLILKASQGFTNKVYIFFWILAACLWGSSFIERLLNIDEYHYMGQIRSIIPSLAWISISLLHTQRQINDKEIREKGITMDGGFVYWKEIVSYRWDEKNKLNIIYRPSGRFSILEEIKKTWKIREVEKQDISKLFEYYTNIDP